jgi:hypothetical protein
MIDQCHCYTRTSRMYKVKDPSKLVLVQQLLECMSCLFGVMKYSGMRTQTYYQDF